jgi:hypothetical protein
MRPSGATCLSADCCFSELAIYLGVKTRKVAMTCSFLWFYSKFSYGLYIFFSSDRNLAFLTIHVHEFFIITFSQLCKLKFKCRMSLTFKNWVKLWKRGNFWQYLGKKNSLLYKCFCWQNHLDIITSKHQLYKI